MTKAIIYTVKGVRYHLGHIHQTIINSEVRFVLLPSFPARPPYCYTKLRGAENRLSALANAYLNDGFKLPKETDTILNGVNQLSYFTH